MDILSVYRKPAHIPLNPLKEHTLLRVHMLVCMDNVTVIAVNEIRHRSYRAPWSGQESKSTAVTLLLIHHCSQVEWIRTLF